MAHGGLSADEISVELYVGQSEDGEELIDPVVMPLKRTEDGDNGTHEYRGGFLPTGAGQFRYGIRVRPNIDDPTELAHLGLVQWA